MCYTIAYLMDCFKVPSHNIQQHQRIWGSIVESKSLHFVHVSHCLCYPERLHHGLQVQGALVATALGLLQLALQSAVPVLDVAELQQRPREASLQLRHDALQLSSTAHNATHTHTHNVTHEHNATTTTTTTNGDGYTWHNEIRTEEPVLGLGTGWNKSIIIFQWEVVWLSRVWRVNTGWHCDLLDTCVHLLAQHCVYGDERLFTVGLL